MKLTKLQYQVIYLYSKALTFNEITTALKISSSKGLYSKVIAKDKGRVTRAKKSKQINLNNYKEDLSKVIDEVKKNHSRNTLILSTVKQSHREEYIDNSIDKSFQSWNRYRLTALKKIA